MVLHGLADRNALLVEDEDVIADDMRQALRRAAPASTVEDALELVRAAILDVAILDLNLGGEPVWLVVDALRARGIRTVFATDTTSRPFLSRMPTSRGVRSRSGWSRSTGHWTAEICRGRSHPPMTGARAGVFLSTDRTSPTAALGKSRPLACGGFGCMACRRPTPTSPGQVGDPRDRLRPLANGSGSSGCGFGRRSDDPRTKLPRRPGWACAASPPRPVRRRRHRPRRPCAREPARCFPGKSRDTRRPPHAPAIAVSPVVATASPSGLRRRQAASACPVTWSML